jgi:glycosyltransferase involved in cell wall biosynthesis
MTATARITLAILAYNQEQFVESAVRSALAQVCEPIEILVSDDCSTDGTFERIQQLVGEYRGPHRAVARRNPENLGIGRHFNALMQAAEGRLVVLMAADDVSRHDRVALTAAAWDRSAERLDLIAAHVVDMDENGDTFGVKRVDPLQDWHGVDDWTAWRPYVIGAAHAVTRRLFDRFGPLAPDCLQEDQVNSLRAILSGGAHTIDDSLVQYRRGGFSSGAHDAATYRGWEARRSAIHLGVYAQWIRDAALCGHEAAVRQAIDPELQRDLFLTRLLAARSLGEQLRIVRSHPAIDRNWRWKRLMKARMFRTYEAAKRLRATLESRPPRDAEANASEARKPG